MVFPNLCDLGDLGVKIRGSSNRIYLTVNEASSMDESLDVYADSSSAWMISGACEA